jgi:protein-tyrosine phosphatase
MSDPTRVLFVCMGNICRSPTAEGVFRHLVVNAGLEDQFEIDSAGTGAWHEGERPDRRATAAAADRGVALSGRARQVTRDDFDDFDLIVAMDSDNLRNLRQLAPAGTEHKLRMLDDVDVPDPYYGLGDHFAEVFDQVQSASERLLDELSRGVP